ncbi:BRO family protein [Orbus mooreae]|uniref:BRO family protein n=1 Tax=Orbus mooreae TaxID=3074107 RepID=UPI00370D1CA5
MSIQLQAFNFEEYQVQSFTINNELFLRAIQLAEILGYKNPRDAIKNHVDKEDVVKHDTLTNGGKQKVLYVNESGMYALILGSTLDTAKRFKRWVTSEVLPTIRKKGSYSLTINPQQQQIIKQAVKGRAYRTGEHYQIVYAKLYEQFKIPRYQELPASQFDNVIDFLGGVSSKSDILTSDELCDLVWVVKAAEHMRAELEEIEPALQALKSERATRIYTMSREYRRTINRCKQIVQQKMKTIKIDRNDLNWQRVLPFIQ